MDGRQSDYPQSGLSSPYPSFPEPHSEGSSADQASAAQYPQGQDPRSANFSSSATPTSEYGLNPSSARSGSFPEYIQRTPYHQSGPPSANAGGMAQTSPSMPLSPDGQPNHHHHSHSMKSDNSVPIDPSIAAAASPTYPQHQQYSPYAPQHDMTHYPPHPATPLYAQRPDWAGHYPGGDPIPYGHAPGSSGPPQPAMVSPVARPPTVSKQHGI
jgi:transcription factor CON7